MITIKDLKLFDVLTLNNDEYGIDSTKQRVVYGINASPRDALNPMVMILDDDGDERWVYLRSFKGYEIIPPVIDYPSNHLH